VISYIEASRVLRMHTHISPSMIVIATCFVSYMLRMVEIATNPKGYHVHAGEVLKRYAPDKNQATPTRYHISNHNFNLDILLSFVR